MPSLELAKTVFGRSDVLGHSASSMAYVNVKIGCLRFALVVGSSTVEIEHGYGLFVCGSFVPVLAFQEFCC